MKLRKRFASPHGGRSAVWLSADSRFAFDTLSRKGWGVTPFAYSPTRLADQQLLVACGIFQTHFPTRRAAITALELVLEGMSA